MNWLFYVFHFHTIQCVFVCIHFTQENFTIDGPKYHFRAKYNICKRKSEKWSRLLTEQEQRDRSQYAFFPSAKGRAHWMYYIIHRAKMLQPGMQVYTQRKFIRLQLDKYIEENRASDKIAVFLTRKLPSLILLGAAQMAPNSPIGIKKRLRCPGVRRLLNSFKKLNNCVVRRIQYFANVWEMLPAIRSTYQKRPIQGVSWMHSECNKHNWQTPEQSDC